MRSVKRIEIGSTGANRGGSWTVPRPIRVLVSAVGLIDPDRPCCRSEPERIRIPVWAAGLIDTNHRRFRTDPRQIRMPVSATGWEGIGRRCSRTGWQPVRELAGNTGSHGTDGCTRIGPRQFRASAIVAGGPMPSVEIIKGSGSSTEDRS
jgi:hypothetical protein